MSNKKRIPSGTARAEQLRNRAVLFEGDRERKQEAAYRKRSASGTPRTRTGSPSDMAARLRRIRRMAADGSELVLLTWVMRSLDGLPLKSEKVAVKGRKSTEGMLKVSARAAAALEAAIHRGGLAGGTHTHLVLRLSDLSRGLQAAALAAPAGKGGGVEYLKGRLHVVRIGQTEDDLERVASYLSRDPDGRFDLPEDHSDFLAAHADELARKLVGVRSPRLSWHRAMPICR